MTQLNWHDLSVLLAASRTPSLSETARTLGVAQTTVARRLDALEEALGIRLVEKRREGTRLTDAGALAAEAAEQMETLALDLERTLVGRSAHLSGALRVTTIDMLAAGHPDLFRAFAELYPDIELSVQVGYGLRSLSRRETDVALRFGTPDPSLFGRRLATFGYGVYAAEALLEQCGTTDPAELPWVIWTAESRAVASAKWRTKHAPNATIACRFDTALALHAAVRAGLGVGILPCAYAGGLTPVIAPLPELAYDLWALTHPDLAGTARVRAFLKHAGEWFDARRTMLEGRRDAT